MLNIARAVTMARQQARKLRHPFLRRNESGRAEFYHQLWLAASAEIGATCNDLGDGFFDIQLGEASTRVCRGLVMLDDPVTLKLAGNKPLVHTILSGVGLPVPRYTEFTLEKLEEAETFLASAGGPCVVKPALDSGGGDGVATNIMTRREVRSAALHASLHGDRLMIEQQVEGDVFRLLYLRGRLLQALRRRAPRLVGDGTSTIHQLMLQENRRRSGQQGALVTRLSPDHDMELTLRRNGFSLHSVPAAGQEILVKTVVNDNARPDNIVVTDQICEELRVECGLAVAAIGSALAAVDIVTGNPGVSLKQAQGAIIEINTTPGLHHHYNVIKADGEADLAVLILKDLLHVQD